MRATFVVCFTPCVLTPRAMSIITGLNVMPNTGTYGGGDPLPAGETFTVGEMVVLLLVILLGAVLWAYVMASMVDVIANSDPETTAFRNTLDSLNRFLRLHSLPVRKPGLCAEIREYFHQTKHLQRARAHDRLYHMMSPTLQLGIARAVHAKWLEVP